MNDAILQHLRNTAFLQLVREMRWKSDDAALVVGLSRADATRLAGVIAAERKIDPIELF
jgi:hypothetical protein